MFDTQLLHRKWSGALTAFALLFMTGIEIQRDGSPHTGGGENRHSPAYTVPHAALLRASPVRSSVCLSVCSSWRPPGSSLPHMEMVRGFIYVNTISPYHYKKKHMKDETIAKYTDA